LAVLKMPCELDHRDPKNWRDEHVAGGRIRSLCKGCGKFIGYRDAATDKQDRTIGRSKR
jgi:hypothetical protein